MKNRRAILPCLVLIFAAACGNKPAPKPAVPPDVSPQPTPALSRPVSSADVVKVSVSNGEIAPGGSTEAKVLISISQGYHVNANPASFPNLIATAVEAEPGSGITFGKPVYPAGVMRTFSFEKRPLSVYEGAATIKLPLKAAGNAEKGARSIPLTIRVQACDNAVCYAPARLNLPLQLTVK